MLASNEFKMNLKVQLNPDELLDRGRKIARLNQDNVDIQAAAQSAAADFKSQIAANAQQASKLSGEVNNGYVYSPVVCRVVMNEPKDGSKTIYRTDTGEIVEAKEMDEHDKQTVMNLDV